MRLVGRADDLAVLADAGDVLARLAGLVAEREVLAAHIALEVEPADHLAVAVDAADDEVGLAGLAAGREVLAAVLGVGVLVGGADRRAVGLVAAHVLAGLARGERDEDGLAAQIAVAARLGDFVQVGGLGVGRERLATRRVDALDNLGIELGAGDAAGAIEVIGATGDQRIRDLMQGYAGQLGVAADLDADPRSVAGLEVLDR